jgi:hypothetical protein
MSSARFAIIVCLSLLAANSAIPSTSPFYGSGFTNAGLTLNGGAIISGSRLRLTDSSTSTVRSAFFSTPVNVQSFTNDFSFQLTNATADGFTFTIQANSPSTLGHGGGGLGYASIPKSVAVKFDLYSNSGEGPDSTGWYANGAWPITPASDMTASGVNLHSGDVMNVHMTYDGATLTWKITDATVGRSFTSSATVNIPSMVGGSTAYVGFTGSTGGQAATQDVLTWTYVQGSSSQQVATPTLQPVGGTYSATQSVTISEPTTGAVIYYTTDGSTPTTSSNRYSAPIAVSTTTTINAMASASGMSDSTMATASYTIQSGTVKPLQITTGSLPGGAVRLNYNAALGAANGTSPYTWGVIGGQWPSGLSLQASSGQISGTPWQAGTFTFSVRVKDSTGQSTSGGFSVNIAPASAPVTSSISPKSGPTSGGTLLTVSGANFQSGATVLFGGVAASSVTVKSATQIQAVVPAHIAGLVDVTVRNPDGQSSTLSGSFTFNLGSLTVTSVSPNSGPATGGTTVTITGTNFQTGALVSFGTASAPTVTVNSATQIQAVTPANAAGAVNLTVQNPDGLTAMLASAFDYAKPQSGSYIFHDGFESGNFSAWTTTYGDGRVCGTTGGTTCGVTINTNPTFVHSGSSSAGIHYFQNADDNRAFIKSFSPSLTNFHLRGYVYFHNNGGNLASGKDIQRKLYYLKHVRSDGRFDWDVILTTHSNGGSSLQPLILIDTGGSCNSQQGFYATNLSLDFNRWHSVELMVRVSDPGVANGSVGLWIDGASATLSKSPTGILNRCANVSDTNGINSFEIGMQAEMPSGITLDEFRYWDDLVVNDTYIGP